MNWVKDKRWADRFLPGIKRILGEHLICAAPEEEDQHRNTDLIVLKLDAVRVACRIRTFDYYARYPLGFTIRSSRPSGVETELAKIIRGWGDYLFYGFSDQAERNLAAWFLGDLDEFRLWFTRRLQAGPPYPWEIKPNGDGSSTFHAFNRPALPPTFVVARYPLSRAA